MPEAPTVIQKTQVDINLSGGIKQGGPEETTDWSSSLTEADNVLVDGNSLISRPGTVGVGTLSTSPGVGGAKLGTLDGKLAVVNGSGALYKLNEAATPILNQNTGNQLGFMPAVSVETTAAGAFNSVAQTYAVVNFTKFKAILGNGGFSPSSVARGIITIIDAANGNIVKRYVGDGICNMVGVDDRYIHAYRYNPSGGALQVAIIDCNTVASMTTDSASLLFLWASTVTGSLTSSDKLAGVVAVTNGSIFVTNGTATSYLRKVSNTNTLTSSTTFTDMDGGATGIDVDSSGNIYIVGYATNFTPASLSLTGWWRDFAAATPWVGTASAGSSGSNNLTEATNRPSAGATLNGQATADFDGTNDQFVGAALSTFYTTTAYSGWALVYIDAINTAGTADPGNSNDCIVCSAGTGAHLVRLSSTGPIVTHYLLNNLGGNATVSATITTGAWNLIQWKYDGTNIKIKVNSAAWVSAAVGGASAFSLAANLGVGKNPNGDNWYDGKMAEMGLADSVISDGNFDSIRQYCNTRYGLSL